MRPPRRMTRFARMVQTAKTPNAEPRESGKALRPNTRDKIEQMQYALKTGVQVIAAPQLFPTPPALAERMVEEADILPGHSVLEPSAGSRVKSNESSTS